MGSKQSACSGSRPATPRESRICEDVVKTVARLKDRADEEYGLSMPRLSCLSRDRDHGTSQSSRLKCLFLGRSKQERAILCTLPQRINKANSDGYKPI